MSAEDEQKRKDEKFMREAYESGHFGTCLDIAVGPGPSGLGPQSTPRGMAETLFRHRAPGINRRR